MIIGKIDFINGSEPYFYVKFHIKPELMGMGSPLNYSPYIEFLQNDKLCNVLGFVRDNDVDCLNMEIVDMFSKRLGNDKSLIVSDYICSRYPPKGGCNIYICMIDGKRNFHLESLKATDDLLDWMVLGRKPWTRRADLPYMRGFCVY